MRPLTPTGGVPTVLAPAQAGVASVPALAAPAAGTLVAAAPAAAPRAAASLELSAQRFAEFPPSSTWRIDTSDFHDPMLAEALPTIVADPARIAEGVSLSKRTSIYGVQLLFHFQNLWRQRNLILSTEMEHQIQEAFVTRLRALEVVSPDFIAAAFPPPTEALFRSALTFARYYVNQLGGPALVPPAEVVVNYLTGLAGLYARWGAGALEVPQDPSPHRFYIRGMGDGFEIRVTVGTYESIGGIDYQCVYRLPHEEHVVMRVGVIRRPGGFAIVKRRAMPDFLKKEFALPDGSRRLLSDITKQRFDHVGEWLLRFALKKLRAEDPDAPLFLKRGIAQQWAYDDIDPPPPFESMPVAVGSMRPSDIARSIEGQHEELMFQCRRLGRLGGAGSPAPDGAPEESPGDPLAKLRRVRNLQDFIARSDRFPHKLGFELEDPESHWLVLRPER
jgi:hypothetical protein